MNLKCHKAKTSWNNELQYLEVHDEYEKTQATLINARI